MPLVPGYNIEGIVEEGSKVTREFSLDEPKRKRRRRKPDFGFLFTQPKNNENMGMNKIFDGEPFEGVL